MFAPITKASIKAKSAQLLPEIFRRAFRTATSGKPGAVHLSIPEDVFQQQVDPASVSLHAEPACMAYPAYPACASRDDLERLSALLAGARRPLIVAGGGVARANAGTALQAIAERFAIPVVTTITGQTSLPDRHALALGNIGDNGFHPHANRAMQEADTLLYAGCRIGSTATIGWSFPEGQDRRALAQIDIDPQILGNAYPNRLAIAGDAASVLGQLLDLPAPSECGIDPDWVPTLNRWRERFWEADARDLERLAAEQGVDWLHPRLVVDALERRLDEPAVIIADPGTPTPYLCRYFRRRDRSTELIFQRAFGSLGYALPAVVGAWHADPGRRPIAMFGDGSLGMAIGELETISRLGIPALLLNFNNSSFGYIKALQRSYGYPRPMSVDFMPVDYAAAARAFHFQTWTAQRPDELGPVLAEALACRGPAFVDLIVPNPAEETPAMYKWMQRKGLEPLEVAGAPLLMAHQ